MPRNNHLALTGPTSPRSITSQQAAAMHAGFNTYTGQLAASVQDSAAAAAATNGQWAEGKANFSKQIEILVTKRFFLFLPILAAEEYLPTEMEIRPVTDKITSFHRPCPFAIMFAWNRENII